MADYQLKITDGYNIAICIPGNVTKLVPNFCDKKTMLHYENLNLSYD